MLEIFRSRPFFFTSTLEVLCEIFNAALHFYGFQHIVNDCYLQKTTDYDDMFNIKLGFKYNMSGIS